jgi:hypothetical protein
MNTKLMQIGIALAIVLTMGFGTLSIPTAVDAQSTTTTNSPSSNSLKGALTSIQNDPADNTTSWIVSGVFRMDNMSGTAQSSSPTFNSSFYMVKTDGTALHKHDIYDLQLTGQPSKSGNSTIFNGTSTVTMRDGPVPDVPTSITLMDDSAVSIWFDPNKVNNHFGDTLIYGTQHLVCVEAPQYCA